MVEALVWSPLTMAPDYTLAEIYAIMHQAGEGGSEIMVFMWAEFWVLSIFVLAIVGTVRTFSRKSLSNLAS